MHGVRFLTINNVADTSRAFATGSVRVLVCLTAAMFLWSPAVAGETAAPLEDRGAPRMEQQATPRDEPAPLPTAVTVSAMYRTYYERERTPDWRRTRRGLVWMARAGTDRFLPWAGIASHHLLAAPYIHYWFETLRHTGPIDTFVVLSPQHFRQGHAAIATTDRSWDTHGGPVTADRERVYRLVQESGAQIDTDAFYREHGVGTLVPFIGEYFPEAKILPIAFRSTEVDRSELERVAVAIDRISFSPDSGRRVFILLSTDFSHHRDPETTRENDQINREILLNLTPFTARLLRCDNVSGAIVLAHVMELRERARRSSATGYAAPSGRCSYTSAPSIEIMANTDSYLIWERMPEDTTSYFFAFVHE
jgi:AmmeMemoRadiSam system protein B